MKMKVRNPLKKNYAKRIAGALSAFASIKEDLMSANDEITDKVDGNNSKINRLTSKNATLASAKDSNDAIIASVSDIIKKGTL